MVLPLELSGKRFGRLYVVSRAPNGNQIQPKSIWACVCDCGNKGEFIGSNLVNGTTKSCGCLQKERTGAAKRKHGKSKNCREYYSWVNMKTRCFNPNSEDWKDYGGRGITVCKRWLGKNGFSNFYADMGEKPRGRYSLDRINTNGNYSPANCRWGTDEIQARNKRSNRWIEYNGLKMILQDWADYFGVNQGNLSISIKAKGIEEVYKFYLKKHDGLLPVKKL